MLRGRLPEGLRRTLHAGKVYYQAWEDYDATALLRAGRRTSTMLVDQGSADQFLEEQLHPHLLEEACREVDRSSICSVTPGGEVR